MRLQIPHTFIAVEGKKKRCSTVNETAVECMCKHALIHVRVRVCACVCARVCVRVSVCVCVRVSVCPCVCARMRVCL